jgi:GNAT superfamily N-acetyltransferase
VRYTIDRADEVPALFATCRSMRAGLLIVRCGTDDIDSVVVLEEAGARLMDTLLYYERGLDDWTGPAESACVIRPNLPSDIDRIEEIARAAFDGYRGHYHVDSRLAASACNEVYASWARRSCESPGVADVVLVAELNGRIEGFAALRANSLMEAEGVLYGVDPAARRLGIYRSLMDASLAWARSNGMNRFVISTQLSNIIVRRVWAGMGFLPLPAWHTFHVWLDDATVDDPTAAAPGCGEYGEAK